jgi:hypothetical protein
MHRSGTSCLAGSLQNAGLHLGKVYTKNKYNLQGNREHIQLNALQDAVLEDNGGSWFEPPQVVIWSDKYYAYLCSIVSEFESYPRWGFKDPRSLFTLSGFQRCLGDDIEFVGTFRNPYSVVKSLQARTPYIDGEAFWLMLWHQYNARLIALWERYHFPLIDFDQSDAQYAVHMDALIKTLKLPTPAADNSGFFNPALRSTISTRTEGLPEHILATYRRLQDISRESAREIVA